MSTDEMDMVDKCYKTENLDLLKKLTLVIPTHNRNYYLSRCLWYHAHFPFGQIIVADSSHEDKKKINKDTISKVRDKFGTNIIYIESEDSDSEIYGDSIFRKWGCAIQHVNTDYSTICTDREFTIPTIYQKSIEFLKNNSNYVCASGTRFDVIKVRKKLIIKPVFTCESYNNQSPHLRLESFAKNRSIIENLFAVYRTEDQKYIYNNLEKNEIYDIRYGEVCLELQPLIIGRVKQFNEILRLRDNSHISNGLFRGVKKSESSNSRHPLVTNYPTKRQQCLQSRLDSSLIQLLSEDFKKDKEIVNRLKDYSKQVIQWWMCPSHPRIYNMLYELWDHIPYSKKIYLAKIIGIEKYKEWKTIKLYTPHIKTIIDIIYGVDRGYTNDTSILDISFIK
ncbi:MAG: TIGR00180 family glycosyltransferase [Lachnospiraceae bacterium]|nr:TIGR00180 family glycosyltransferase [Lachnospiraceae bacterium]